MTPSAKRLTYADAGVDVKSKASMLSGIAGVVRSTYTAGVVGDTGAFAGMFRASFPEPLIATWRTHQLNVFAHLREPELRSPHLSDKQRVRYFEVLDGAAAQTPYMRAGDRIRIEAFDAAGRSVFGAIEQHVVAG